MDKDSLHKIIPPESIIRSSQKGWFGLLVQAAKLNQTVNLIDDAQIGFKETMAKQGTSLLQIGRQASLSVREVSAVLIALGISGVGIAMLLFSWFDPEPTSKLASLVIGGVICVLTGGSGAIFILTQKKARITATKAGFHITWE